jgi:hypothetical protein
VLSKAASGCATHGPGSWTTELVPPGRQRSTQAIPGPAGAPCSRTAVVDPLSLENTGAAGDERSSASPTSRPRADRACARGCAAGGAGFDGAKWGRATAPAPEVRDANGDEGGQRLHDRALLEAIICVVGA